MDKKAKQKKEIKAFKKKQEEHLTNWYMINMCWSIFGIIALFIIQRVYNWASGAASTIRGYEISLWIVACAWCERYYKKQKTRTKLQHFSVYRSGFERVDSFVESLYKSCRCQDIRNVLLLVYGFLLGNMASDARLRGMDSYFVCDISCKAGKAPQEP